MAQESEDLRCRDCNKKIRGVHWRRMGKGETIILCVSCHKAPGE